MTSPITKIRVKCTGCGVVFSDYHRASFNFNLGEEYSDEHMREMSTARCPWCDHVTDLDTLIVVGGVWRWNPYFPDSEEEL